MLFLEVLGFEFLSTLRVYYKVENKFPYTFLAFSKRC